MQIPHPNSLKQDASRALQRGREPQKLIIAYAGLIVLLSAFVTVANYWLGQQIGGTGGLSQLGTRAFLSTAQTVLPMVQSAVLMCLQLGYLQGMLRIARGQYADHTDLKVGFQRFWPLLRMTLLQAIVYFAVGIVTFYFSMQVFMLTPWADSLYEIVEPIAGSATILDSSYVLDDATMVQMTNAMIPMFILYAVLYGVLAVVISYRFRMANYALLDNPHAGALAALRASRMMMRRNAWKLLRLDISFWWFHGLNVLAGILCYGDVLLPMLGIELPIPAIAGYFLFYGLYLLTHFAIEYFLRNHVEATYVMAYESICPRPKENGAVLGNIFDM